MHTNKIFDRHESCHKCADPFELCPERGVEGIEILRVRLIFAESRSGQNSAISSTFGRLCNNPAYALKKIHQYHGFMS